MDDDGDNVTDSVDQCATTPIDDVGLVNPEGCGPSERDTDGDGVNDDLDAFPNDPGDSVDSDGDGFGDNAEFDAGSDPNDPNDQPALTSLPIWLLFEASRIGAN